MAKRSFRRQMATPPATPGAGARPGPRRLLPAPANDNRLPPHLRGVRTALLASCFAVLLWSLWRLIAA